MTWAHRPHGVRTRGKKSLTFALGLGVVVECPQQGVAFASSASIGELILHRNPRGHRRRRYDPAVGSIQRGRLPA